MISLAALSCISYECRHRIGGTFIWPLTGAELRCCDIEEAAHLLELFQDVCEVQRDRRNKSKANRSRFVCNKAAAALIDMATLADLLIENGVPLRCRGLRASVDGLILLRLRAFEHAVNRLVDLGPDAG